MNTDGNIEPNIILPESAFNDNGYVVQLGGQRFTDAQWEAVQQYMQHAVQPEHRAQRQNRIFHEAMGIETAATPRAIPAADVPVVIELIREEFVDELIPALGARVEFNTDGSFKFIRMNGAPNVVEIYDALLDILYVTYGALNRAGMKAAPGYDEVQASNMSKLGADGKPIIAQENDPDGIFPGRVKKGPNYFKPDLARVLNEQALAADKHEDPLAHVDYPAEGYDDHQDH